MTFKNWQVWGKIPNEVENTLADRATGKLPEMESTKQLVELVSNVYEPKMKILDAGCNAGHYLKGLRRFNSDLEYTGVDAYEHYIKKAKEIFNDDPHAKFEVRDIFNPLFPENPFDIVYCCNVLLHLPDFRKPVQNLLLSTKHVCFIRTLLGENTSIVKTAKTQNFDNEGNPTDYVYQNTWNKEYFIDYITTLGWNTEIIQDKFNSTVLQNEFQKVKGGKGTKIMDNKQVDGNIIFNWVWLKITPKTVPKKF